MSSLRYPNGVHKEQMAFDYLASPFPILYLKENQTAACQTE